MELKHIAGREGRLSSFLRGEMELSAGLMNRLKWQEKLLVNGKPEHTDYSVKVGDEISVLLDAPAPEYPAQQGALEILYEDDCFLAVEKPAGMLIHPSRSCFTGTLANFVMGYYEKTGQSCAFHPITRLDRDTFGVVLLAKNAHIHSVMQKNPLQKTYHALVFGCPELPSGVIDAPIARKPLPSLLREISAQGKPSVTKYEILRRQGPFTLLSLCPVTGRTHQLRLHCAYAGFPILGDPQYGTERTGEISEKLGLFHQRLCAKAVSFSHPVTGQRIEIVSHQTASLE